jgi:hypothetical protein
MTPSQLSTLKADMLADPAIVTMIQAGNALGIKKAYNAQTATPCWRTSLPFADAWAGVDKTEYIALGQGNRDAFALMFREGSVNPSIAAVRQDFTDIIPVSAPNTRAGLSAAAQRMCSRVELLFATGGAVKTLVFEGALGAQDVADALRS